MKNLNTYITEKFKIRKGIKNRNYKYFPKNCKELKKIITTLLEQRGPDADLNDIDVSKITEFFYEYYGKTIYLFQGLDPHNIDISDWNVSNATDMRGMFAYCRHFNCDLSDWDVSNVTNMQWMFYWCEDFKAKGLENWNVSNVTDMSTMFSDCHSLNCDFSTWDISKVTDTHSMFSGSIVDHNYSNDFNIKGLEKWNTKNVKDMSLMFSQNKKFNCDISFWNTSKVTNMHAMFYGAEKFNSDLSKWDVSKVTDMEFAFKNCDSLKKIPAWYHE